MTLSTILVLKLHEVSIFFHCRSYFYYYSACALFLANSPADEFSVFFLLYTPLHSLSHFVGGDPRVVVSTAALHARVRGSVPGLCGLKKTKNISSPSTCESQYCGEPP